MTNHRTGDQPEPKPGSSAAERRFAAEQNQIDLANQMLGRGTEADPDPQDLSEDQAKFPPFPVTQNHREAIDMAFNEYASDTMRVAAFRSLPMDLARFLLDELGWDSFKQYLNEQKALKSLKDDAEPAAWDAEVQHKAAERAQYAARRRGYDTQLGAIKANEPKIPQSQPQVPAIDWLKEAGELARQPPERQKALKARQVRKNGERKMARNETPNAVAADARTPLALGLDEYGDLLADLSSQIDRLNDRLRPILRASEPEAEAQYDDGDSDSAPAVSYVRSHNVRLIRSIEWLSSIIDRLEC